MSSSQSPILVINNRSSSLKFSVFDPKSEKVLSSGLAERIGTEQGLLKLGLVNALDRRGVRVAFFKPISQLMISVGPMLEGLRRPVNDLSRVALVDDIVYTIALTAIQAT